MILKSKKSAVHILFVCLIWICGLAGRTYLWNQYPFNFDQVQILENASNIIHGKLTLIGPRTGPAAMFTGPFIYYWTAFWMLFQSGPKLVVLSSLTIAGITGVVLYHLAKRNLLPAHKYILLGIWAFSPYLIELDRFLWNPNLSLMAASLVIFPFLNMKTRRLNNKDILIICSGVALGYQAHFTGLFLLPLALLLLFFHRPTRGMYFVSIISSFILSIFPTILFDLRHNWLNVFGFIDLIKHPGTVSQLSTVERITNNFNITFENIGKMFFLGMSHEILVGAGIILFILYLMVSRKSFQNAIVPLIWVMIIPIFFSFYKGSMPEYYFVIEFPAILIMIATVMNGIYLKHKKTMVFFVVLIIAICINRVDSRLKNGGGIYLGDQYRATDFIRSQTNVSRISYDLLPELSTGVKYLCQNCSTSSTGVVVAHLIYPIKSALPMLKEFGNIGVWLELDTVNK